MKSHDSGDDNQQTVSPEDGPAELLLRAHDTSLEYHRILLDDAHRMDAYERAIRALVRPGDVVLDLGTGTGILAMLAARRGAARVHAVESAAVVGLARDLIVHNGLEDIITVHVADITEMAPVEPVDLVVSDCMGRFVVDDGMVRAMDAANAWLAPHGRFCPGKIDMMWAPIGDVHMRAVELFDEPMYGLDLSPARIYALNYSYYAHLSPRACMAPPGVYASVVPGRARQAYAATATFRLTRGGKLQGVAGWFTAELAPDVTLTTEPGVETHWGQYVFPLPETEVLVGDSLEVTLSLASDPSLPPGQATWRWAGGLRRDGEPIATFSQEALQRLGERGPVREGPP